MSKNINSPDELIKIVESMHVHLKQQGELSFSECLSVFATLYVLGCISGNIDQDAAIENLKLGWNELSEAMVKND